MITSTSVSARSRSRRRFGRGQSLVEFALAAPVVLLLLAGVIDLGRAIYYSVQITNAAAQGVRLAVLPDRVCNTIVGIQNNCNGSGIGGTAVCGAVTAALAGVASGNINCTESGTLSGSTAGQAYVEVDQFTTYTSTNPCASTGTSTATTPRANGNDPIRVQVRYYYRPITPLLSSLFPSSFYLQGQACGRAEY